MNRSFSQFTRGVGAYNRICYQTDGPITGGGGAYKPERGEGRFTEKTAETNKLPVGAWVPKRPI